ncbi:MAG: HAMP domain-containing sensor histidine kinase, partial [Candidatus Nanopelagicales bacterium]
QRAALRAAAVVDLTDSTGESMHVPGIEGDTALAAYSRDGKLVSGKGPVTSSDAARSAREDSVVQADVAGSVVVYVPINSGHETVGAVRAAGPVGGVWTKIAVTWLAMLGLGIVAVAVAVAIARRLARRLTTPLVALAASAQVLGDGDFSVRTTPSGVREIDQTGEALNSTAIRLGTMVERERRFSANASHQLRTPLTALRLRLENAVAEPAGLTADVVAEALESADALERTIEELLRLARDGDSPRHVRDPQPIDAVIQDAERRWSPQLVTSGRAMRIRIDPDLPLVDCSTTAIEQILDVLLDNALKHGKGAVEVLVRDSGTALALAVRDSGDGVRSDEDVFARGFSGNGGHGIGLALARELAESQDGRLLLTRASPSTEFTLLLPAYPEQG